MLRSGGRWILTSAAVVAATPAWHLGVLTLASVKPHRCGVSTSKRFVIVVPAHNESESIGATLASLRELDYPADRFRIVVVADNCTDDTADVVRAAGVDVLERVDPDRRGKGYALDYAFQRVADGNDAVVVIDADTDVDRRFLTRMAFHLEQGAVAIQADYRVRNPQTSWRTRLLDVAFTCKHQVQGRGREALGCSVGLHGNGMVFTTDLLREVPYSATSVVEDIEYGLMLVDAGHVVQHCDDTYVGGDMPGDAESAAPQRVRWELGHAEMRRKYGWKMLPGALARGDRQRVDAALGVITPPLATTVGTIGAIALVGAVGQRYVGRGPLRVAAAGGLALLGHVATGLVRSPSSWQAIPAIASVPWYLAWKVGVRASSAWQEQSRDGAVWTRTERSTASQPEPLDLVVN